jgi:hypothetical protein
MDREITREEFQETYWVYKNLVNQLPANLMWEMPTFERFLSPHHKAIIKAYKIQNKKLPPVEVPD